MNNEKIIIENTFKAGIAKVWAALSNHAEMKKWYFTLEDFQAKVGFKFSFTGGPENGTQYVHLCEVTEVIEGKKLAYSWRYDGYLGNTTVIWELTAEGKQTSLKLTHTGLHTFDANEPDFASANFVAGWTYFVHTALKNHLNN